MCILRVTHRLIHDKRTTILPDPAKPDELLVNPYANSKPCRCGQTSDIAGYLRCSDHDCCRTIARFERCSGPEPCANPLPFHRYQQRTKFARCADTDCVWDSLPVIDAQLYYLDDVAGLVQSCGVMALRAWRVEMQEELGRVGTELLEWAVAVDTARAEYESDGNSVCRRVLNSWEDPAAIKLEDQRHGYDLCEDRFMEIVDELAFLDDLLLGFADKAKGVAGP